MIVSIKMIKTTNIQGLPFKARASTPKIESRHAQICAPSKNETSNFVRLDISLYHRHVTREQWRILERKVAPQSATFDKWQVRRSRILPCKTTKTNGKEMVEQVN
jgi:hypothetical protein